MLGYLPLTIDPAPEFSLPTGPQIGNVTTYAHPSRALAEAQVAAATGEGLSVLVIVTGADDEWGACCPDCYVGVGDRHRCDRRKGDGVMTYEAVLRPANQLRDGLPA